MEKIEQDIIKRVQRIASLYAERDLDPLDITINISGKCLGKTQLKYEVTVKGYSYESTEAKANTLKAAVDEYFRRRGFNETHCPELLTYDEAA